MCWKNTWKHPWGTWKPTRWKAHLCFKHLTCSTMKTKNDLPRVVDAFPASQNSQLSTWLVWWEALTSLTLAPRQRPSSTMSCWPTYTHRQTRPASWRSQLTRPRGGMTCCACTMHSRRRSTSSGTSAPALCLHPCPHLLMTPGSRAPAATGLWGLVTHLL